MWTFLLTRVLQALFTLWVVSVLVFFAARLTGSPDLALLPPDALPEHRQAFKQAYGLDKPVLVQYWRWISRAVQGDLGQGIQHKIAVSEFAQFLAICRPKYSEAVIWGNSGCSPIQVTLP